MSSMVTRAALDLGSGGGSHIAQLVPNRRNVTIADITAADLEAGKKTYGR